jgi:hypothetical protein
MPGIEDVWNWKEVFAIGSKHRTECGEEVTVTWHDESNAPGFRCSDGVYRFPNGGTIDNKHRIKIDPTLFKSKAECEAGLPDIPRDHPRFKINSAGAAIFYHAEKGWIEVFGAMSNETREDMASIAIAWWTYDSKEAFKIMKAEEWREWLKPKIPLEYGKNWHGWMKREGGVEWLIRLQKSSPQERKSEGWVKFKFSDGKIEEVDDGRYTD